MNKKVILLILDGWGIAKDTSVSAIEKAKTPFMDRMFQEYPNSTLEASGLSVGLPEGQMGNSEVGHMNIGAGRVVYQDLVKISNAVNDGSIAENETLKSALGYARENKKPIHLIGLVSDGGVHSHINHLKGLLSSFHQEDFDDVYIHAFTDGRDTDPKGGVGYIRDLQHHMAETTGTLATITGRYFAMDRDNRWERVKLAYDAMVHGEGKKVQDPLRAMEESYMEGVTDEFLKPIICANAKIQEGDVVLCFNFRTDRGRQITQALTQKDFPDHEMKKMNLHYVTMTNYDASFKGVHVMYGKENLTMTMGEVLEKNKKKQIRIAETEKYPHVTFFFSGGREEPFDGETRLLCPSPKVATYDLQPEMSAHDIRDKIIPELKNQSADFICLNFANPDMVGHTGVFEAAVKACETVDSCTESVVNSALENDYLSIIIADHGNSDMMINPDGTPNTAHTTNLVPFIVVDKEFKGDLKSGKLGDLAPTMLQFMGVDVPKEMTGEVLI
ncbi:phosphoglycerate mutase [Ekhidna lutea]|uniref:2,3-bisphosphoglycerate-independent phosphoglycerate mutase n=1 Tax=Ekhidna lutea TaxID=447679 RepID=A0A239ESU6_EKHLU|nr:2,3-bisphosphoglycerate-independent phosphoglycerate mutase [Ekhidna lutea]SNS47707.1 phosphoglycerate mutase [Ekhidna lutea]